MGQLNVQVEECMQFSAYLVRKLLKYVRTECFHMNIFGFLFFTFIHSFIQRLLSPFMLVCCEF